MEGFLFYILQCFLIQPNYLFSIYNTIKYEEKLNKSSKQDYGKWASSILLHNQIDLSSDNTLFQLSSIAIYYIQTLALVLVLSNSITLFFCFFIYSNLLYLPLIYSLILLIFYSSTLLLDRSYTFFNVSTQWLFSLNYSILQLSVALQVFIFSLFQLIGFKWICFFCLLLPLPFGTFWFCIDNCYFNLLAVCASTTYFCFSSLALMDESRRAHLTFAILCLVCSILSYFYFVINDQLLIVYFKLFIADCRSGILILTNYSFIIFCSLMINYNSQISYLFLFKHISLFSILGCSLNRFYRQESDNCYCYSQSPNCNYFSQSSSCYTIFSQFSWH